MSGCGCKPRLGVTIKKVVAESVDLSEGDVIGKLEIPQIGISVMVLQGVKEETLRLGAGHVPGTPLPGADGNSAIAAHRDTFFRKLKRIRAGDRIQFLTVRGTAQYVVDSTEIVEPADTQVMESRGRPELTLISCYPFYFVGAAPRRFIVHATRTTVDSLRRRQEGLQIEHEDSILNRSAIHDLVKLHSTLSGTWRIELPSSLAEVINSN